MINCENGRVKATGSPETIYADLGTLVAAIVRMMGDKSMVLESCIFGLYEDQIMNSADPMHEMSKIHETLVREGIMERR